MTVESRSEYTHLRYICMYIAASSGWKKSEDSPTNKKVLVTNFQIIWFLLKLKRFSVAPIFVPGKSFMFWMFVLEEFLRKKYYNVQFLHKNFLGENFACHFYTNKFKSAWLPISIPGADPTTASYNASAVKIYNATISLVLFWSKIIFFNFEKTH
jgi:hypothetical protein